MIPARLTGIKRNRPGFHLLVAACILLLLQAGCDHAHRRVTIYSDQELPQVRFAVEELKSVLAEKGMKPLETGLKSAEIVLFLAAPAGSTGDSLHADPDFPEKMPEEGFAIRKDGNKRIRVVAGDAAGLMYGGLELAEQIRLYGLKGITEVQQSPYMEMRGVKFNIPLDVRTPSYTDMSDAAQQNMAEVWDFGFWKEYIDNLARYRYNFISLWSLHPFPSMVMVPEYPDVALDDVKRSTVQWNEYYSTRATDFESPDILDHTETLVEMHMADKIAFWKKVMKYGKERNIDFFVVTWNIYVYGTGGKYGITADLDNTITRDYFRKSVSQMFRTYPDLAGIGLTTGENMGSGDFQDKEEWAFDTYARGVMHAAGDDPERKITLIHRQHETGAKEIAKKFEPLEEFGNIEFLFSFKYAKARAMSCIEQPFHEEFVKDIQGMKTIWTLRNDDNYYFRWGAPDYVRQFMKNIPYEVSKGYYYGSDQYVWGREFLSREPEMPRQLEVVKHWYHWMLWGRLGYDPDLSNERFVDLLQTRFGGIDASRLFTAWQEASMVYPSVTAFHWTNSDYQFYLEGCKSRPAQARNESGFHDVNRFISIPTHARSGFQSIPDYVQSMVKGEDPGLKDPLVVAGEIHARADRALEIIEGMNPGDHKELRNTIADIRAMAYLGKYYAFKIHGAAQLALFRETGETEFQEEAIDQLSQALEYWVRYTGTARQQYLNPLWTNRVGHVDWEKLTEEVRRDVAIASENF